MVVMGADWLIFVMSVCVTSLDNKVIVFSLECKQQCQVRNDIKLSLPVKE